MGTHPQQDALQCRVSALRLNHSPFHGGERPQVPEPSSTAPLSAPVNQRLYLYKTQGNTLGFSVGKLRAMAPAAVWLEDKLATIIFAPTLLTPCSSALVIYD